VTFHLLNEYNHVLIDFAGHACSTVEKVTHRKKIFVAILTDLSIFSLNASLVCGK
jgi:hypothetical protein